MVHQHFMLMPSFTVAENLLFTFEPLKGIFIDKRKSRQIAQEISTKFGLAIEPDKKIGNCSLSMQQRVEILKILLRGATILIFDEPTAVLTPNESQELFSAFAELKKAGKSIIFITHKLREVIAIADRATIMRKGKVIDTINIRDTDLEELAEKMVGRSIDMSTRKSSFLNRFAFDKAKEILKVKNLSTINSLSGTHLSNISFSVKQGEILGIAGVGGNGQEELVECITGLSKDISSGSIFYHDIDITTWAANKIRNLGIAHITGDRYGRGVCTKTNVYENLIMGAHNRPPFIAGPFMKRKQLHDLSEQLIKRYDIKTNSKKSHIMDLSGGNIQKCILARELNLASDLIIAEEPTRGVDIGSIEYIHNQMRLFQNSKNLRSKKSEFSVFIMKIQEKCKCSLPFLGILWKLRLASRFQGRLPLSISHGILWY